MKKLLNALASFAPQERILLDQPMSKYTSFRIGGPADVIFLPENAGEIIMAKAMAEESGVPVTVVGCGSNLLVSDDGIRGLVILLGKPFSAVEVQGNVIHAQAGARMSALANAALNHSLTGLEFASGIPGSVGGGVYMNAGAYGGQMSDVTVEVEMIRDGMVVRVPAEEMDFGYRHSAAMEDESLIVGATFVLQAGDAGEIRAKMDDLNGRRRDKQPLEYPSAGSVFKRPEGYFAGALIEQSGLKGCRIGGAEVSEKHAGFIVNRGGATAQDVCDLVAHVQKTVKENFGVWMETEIRFVGGEGDQAERG